MQITNLVAITAAALIGFMMPTPSQAMSATEKLQDCLKNSVSESEKNTMIRWMASMIAAYPGAVSRPIYERYEMDEIDRSMAFITTRLITQACRLEMKDANAQDADALKTAFGALTRDSVSVIFSSPEVQRRAQNYIRFMDMAHIVNMTK